MTSALAIVAVLPAVPASAADAVLSGEAPYLHVGDLLTINVPNDLATWTIVPIAEQHFTHELRVYNVDGSGFGAFKFHARAGSNLQTTVTHGPTVPMPTPDLVPLVTPTASAQSQHCSTGVHGYQVCADLSYSNNVIWNQANALGDNNYCYQCLTDEGCYQSGCNQALFTVQGDTYASACWAWGWFNTVSTVGAFDGASATSDSVYTGFSSTHC